MPPAPHAVPRWSRRHSRILQPGHRLTGDRRDTVRGAGWEWAHVCVDDASRLAYVEVLPDERTPSVLAFIQRAAHWLAGHGVRARRIMTTTGRPTSPARSRPW